MKARAHLLLSKRSGRWTIDYRTPESIFPGIKSRADLMYELEFHSNPHIKMHTPDSPRARRAFSFGVAEKGCCGGARSDIVRTGSANKMHVVTWACKVARTRRKPKLAPKTVEKGLKRPLLGDNVLLRNFHPVQLTK